MTECDIAQMAVDAIRDGHDSVILAHTKVDSGKDVGDFVRIKFAVAGIIDAKILGFAGDGVPRVQIAASYYLQRFGQGLRKSARLEVVKQKAEGKP